MSRSDPALVVRDLAVERGGRVVLDGIGFSLRPGAALVIEGPNGSGKTTLLRALAGLLRPVGGAIDNPFLTAFAGHEVALKPGVSLGDELAHWARLDGAEWGAVTAAAEAFALVPLLSLPAGILSSGQRRRAALARVAASGASLWLLDEPEAGLDAASRTLLAAVIARHRGDGGLVVTVTHGDLGLDHPGHLRLGTPAKAAA